MALYSQLKGLFTPDAVKRYLSGAEPVESTVVDTVYPKSVQSPFPAIGVADVQRAAKTVPFVTRGGQPIHVGGPKGAANLIEPLPIKIFDDISGQDLSNLRMIAPQLASLSAWRQAKLDYFRQVIRATCEAVAAQSLTGTISWPVARDDGAGYDTWEYNYGAPISYEPETLWDAAEVKAAAIRKALKAMRTAVRKAGLGGKVRFWAGEDAFQAAYSVVEGMTAAQQLKIGFKVEVKEGALDFGGLLLEEMSETYPHPQTGEDTPKVPADAVVAWADGGGWTRFYAALDDLDSGLQPLPFFVKPVEAKRTGNIELIAQCKFLPAPVPRAICWATVLGGGE